jgi:hypothetical protein
MTAADVLGRYLIARENVPVYDLPNGNRIGEIKKGNSTAEVYSLCGPQWSGMVAV